MSAALIAAAALTVLVGVAHSYLGERYIIRRLLRRDDLPRLLGSDWFTRRTLRFAWHLTTVAWFGLAAVMVLLADQATEAAGGAQSIGRAIAMTFGLSAIIAAAASRFRHLAWMAFAAIATLVGVGV